MLFSSDFLCIILIYLDQICFSYMVAVNFFGGGNQKKPLTCRKSVMNYHIMLYPVHLVWAGFQLTTLVVIRTDCIDSCKSNYHTITTALLVLVFNAPFNNIWVIFWWSDLLMEKNIQNCLKPQTNIMTWNSIKYTLQCVWIKLTTSVVINIGCIEIYKSNHCFMQ